tara:strand:- start:35 stop:445 length:411 start_codon:yes stop_codon:yes gene_type:complete
MICTYCKDIADTLDHVIPHSYVATNSKQIRTYNKNEVVPCCRECNSLLGSKLYFTIAERADYLYTTYKKRYKKLLSIPEWDENDLKEIKNNLKKYIEASIKEKKIIQIRIDYCELIRNTSPTIKNVWEEIENSELS